MTPKKFHQGDVREDGYIFRAYSKGVAQWASPRAFHKSRVRAAFHRCKERASNALLEFDLDVPYLLSIFPKDGNCPALGIRLAWGSGDLRLNSPSLDRIIPSKGYTKGNVRFLSNKANMLKSSATPDEIARVAAYLKDMNCP